jgi:N-acetylneuraminate synthase/sialic acid synthase
MQQHMSIKSERNLAIDGVSISDDSDCYIIAELGHNHQGSVEKCKEMIHKAKECGANAVKLQKRDNKSMFTAAAYNAPYDNENSFGATYGEHREALEFGKAQYRELMEFSKKEGITFFSTAFDIPSADFLADLDVCAYKIASGDATNIPLIRHVARFGKPMIVSTGGAELDDVRRVYEAVMPINRQLCILQCTAGYPPSFEELNLRVIETYRNEFPDIVVGLSSHDSGIAMALVGYVLGARVLEKHFTLNRAMKGTDHAFSLEPPGMSKLVRDLRRARAAMGDGLKRRYQTEDKPLLKMGKKLVAARDLPAGHVIAASDIAVMSPGDGLAPYHLDALVGRRLSAALSKDASIAFEHFA